MSESIKNLIILILAALLVGCSPTNESNLKATQSLADCYVKQCDLSIEGLNLTFDYPMSPCLYESREKCIQPISEQINEKFCDGFKYRALCYEDLAVLAKNENLCDELQKPSKNDQMFQMLKQANPNKTEDALFKEYTEALKEDNSRAEQCKAYYELARRTVDADRSHCDGLKYTEGMYCYTRLIYSFSTPYDCDRYRDLVQSEDFGETKCDKDLIFNQCYSIYGAVHDNISVCDHFDGKEKECCIYFYNYYKHDLGPSCISSYGYTVCLNGSYQ